MILALDPGSLPPERRLAVAQTLALGLRIKMCSPFQPFFVPHAGPPRDHRRDPPVLVENIGLYATLPPGAKRVMTWPSPVRPALPLAPAPLTALLIKLDSPGPVSSSRSASALNGRVFRMIKFRSMRTGADTKIHQEYLQKMIQNGEHSGVDAGKPVYKIVNDPRITRLGRFIRRPASTSCRSFINVLRGD